MLAMLFLPAVCWAQADLTSLNLEDLAKVEVTSASRKSESLSSAPAAIYVLTADAIQQGGFRNLPDALRTVPGLYVAQTDAHIWQISARGFSDLNNNKMLVLVDGRSVYTPLYGGGYWDALDIPVENIDRVEVIRGPGGTLWGANAVNGVINIVTKSASQAEGTLVSASLDKDEGYTATVRYGGSIGSKLGYYIYGRASYWELFQSPTGGNIPNRLMLPQSPASGLDAQRQRFNQRRRRRLRWPVAYHCIPHEPSSHVAIEGKQYPGPLEACVFPALQFRDLCLL